MTLKLFLVKLYLLLHELQVDLSYFLDKIFLLAHGFKIIKKAEWLFEIRTISLNGCFDIYYRPKDGKAHLKV